MSLLLAAFVAALPFASIRLTEVDGFIPAIQAMIFVADLVTAVLLFNRFSLVRSRALLVLANGYFFAALMVIPHTLTFPRAFAAEGLLGAGPQSAGWLYVIWHLGFAAAVIGYAVLKDRSAPKDTLQISTLSAIFWSAAILIGLVCAITWGLTAGDKFLPHLFLGRTTFAPLVSDIGLFIAVVFGLALSLLWIRQRSVLDQWLMIVVFATLLEMTMVTLFSAGRFDVGWYSVRIFGVVASTVVLIALVSETTTLYAKLALSIEALKRERDSGLVNIETVLASVAHELRQPLTAITMKGAAARNWLRREPPDLDKAQRLLDETVRASLSTSGVFDSIRALFGSSGREQSINVNEIVLEVLKILSDELKSHGVSTSEELSSELRLIDGHKGQLREVVLNLVQNAIDAMDTVQVGPRTLRLKTEQDGSERIAITIEDSGSGIDPEKIAKIFDAYFTTKASGTGLGLAICRMIIDRHGGQISVLSNPGRGTQFRILLPSERHLMSACGTERTSRSC
jgi:signal transduction histidine kinase